MLKRFAPRRPKSLKAQITDHVRDEIALGRLKPGDKLPSTQELARIWKTQVAIVHAALTPLAREGLIARARRRGTVVQEPVARLERLGVYLSSNVWLESDGAFVRAVCGELEKAVRSRGGVMETWVDPRPESARGEAWHDLAEAARRRTVHAIAAPRVDLRCLKWLRALPVPTAFLTSNPIPSSITFDMGRFAREGVEELARRGCASAGLISVLARDQTMPEGRPHPDRALYTEFRAAAKEKGIEVRPGWIKTPSRRAKVESEAEGFGYDSFRSLWRSRERPDGLIVYTDVAARGVLMAAAEAQVRMPDGLKLALHRNAEVGLFCPYSASFLDVRVADVARKMLEIVDAQLGGDEPKPVWMTCKTTRARRAQKRR